jgi:O-antigen ligase
LHREASEEKEIWFKNTPAILLAVLTFWLGIQNGWALSAEDHSYATTLFAKFVLLFYMLYAIVDNEKNIKIFSLAHIIGCAYLGWIAHNTAGGGRFEGIGGASINDANAFGTHMATALILAGILFLNEKGIIRIILAISAAFILNAIILTQSRGAFLGLVCGGISTYFFIPKRKRMALYMISVVGIFSILILGHQQFFERLKHLREITQNYEVIDESSQSRIEIIKAQFQMFSKKPIRGYGHRGTTVLSPDYIDRRWLYRTSYEDRGSRASHNTFMTLLVEQGILGGIFYIYMLRWAINRIMQLKKYDVNPNNDSLGMYRAGFGGGLIVLYSAGQFADYLRLEAFIWCLALLVTISGLYKKEEEPLKDAQKQKVEENFIY